MEAAARMEKALRGYIDDLAWTEANDVLARQRLQAQLSICFKELLKLTLAPREFKKCVWVFQLLADVSKGDAEIACLIAKSGLLGEALMCNVEIQDHCEQEVLYHTFSLALCVAKHVPDSTVLENCTAAFAGLASGTWHYQALRAVQIQVTEILVHLCYGRVSRSWVSSALSVNHVDGLMEAAQMTHETKPVREHRFVACMLLANLCELLTDKASASPSRGDETGTFGYLAESLWRTDDFFVSLAAALAASARGEPWPPDSETYWQPWKLAHTVERLSRHGYAVDLSLSIAPLADLVVRGHATQETAIEQQGRMARLAIEAMRSISSAFGDIEQLRRDVHFAVGSAFEKALEDLSEEHPAAEDLLDIYFAGRDPLPYLHTDLT